MSEKHYLRKMNEQMGRAEYDMYRAIPAEEIGMENPCHWMSYDEWREWLKTEIAREFDEGEESCITYIMYLGDYPIGRIRMGLNEETENGNISYVIRPVCRGTGLGITMLRLAIEEAKKYSIRRLVGFTNKHNVASQKTMEECGFEFVGEDGHGWSREYHLMVNGLL